jgi:hypothetical protein
VSSNDCCGRGRGLVKIAALYSKFFCYLERKRDELD